MTRNSKDCLKKGSFLLQDPYYSELSNKRTGCNKRTGGKILSKQLSKQDVISEQGGGNTLK